MKLVFSPKAAEDLEEIGDYIARDNPKRAVSFVDEIEQHCYRVAEIPQAFPEREDIAPGLRMAVHGKYLILYGIQNDTVRVERIVHGARRLSDLF
jgi:toxin ParE1/3/4